MLKSATLAAALSLAALSLAACGDRGSKATAEQLCRTAVYRLADGRILDLAPSDGGDLRWRLGDGRTGKLSAKDHWKSTLGWTTRPDGVNVGVGGCDAPTITFQDPGKAPVSGARVPLVARDMTFAGDGVTLHGRLVMPEGDGQVPVMVEVHGSEKDAATVFNPAQRIFPAMGVGVFVYDKRGTGQSTGKYTQDFVVLARDAAAAGRAARAAAGARLSRLGFRGGSQGGWIAPLASTMTPVDFVIADFGLAGSPAEENTDETVLEMQRKGYAGADLAAIREVAEAVNLFVGSGFKDSTRLDAVRARYHDKSWWKQLNGQYTGQVIKWPSWVVKLAWPFYDVHTPINYDSMPVLRRVTTPMLWVVADDDTLAPNATTRARLAQLIAAGQPVTVVAFPHSDHGIINVEVAPNGERKETRYADGFFRTSLDFATTGMLKPPYGDSVVIGTPKAPSPGASPITSSPSGKPRSGAAPRA